MSVSTDEQARLDYYLSRRQVGSYLNKPLAFYSGAPSIPNSFTANLLFTAGGRGPGAKILNGVGQIPGPPPCDTIFITSLSTQVFADLEVTVSYNVLPGDIYILFNTLDGTLLPLVSVTPILGGVVITFNDDSPPATSGTYTFKIMRASNPASCFAIRQNAFVISPAVCLLDITNMMGDGVFPNPGLLPGELGKIVTLTGTGFLSGGPITVAFRKANPPPPFNPLDINLVTIIDDMTLTIDFNVLDGGLPPPGIAYGVDIFVNANPLCMAEYGFSFLENPVVVIAPP